MTTNKSVIYETTGRAREYNELAINLFVGCGHKCSYCYAPVALHMDPEVFYLSPHPRLTRDEIYRGVYAWTRKQKMMGKPWPYESRTVLLCFTCDPYQPIEEETKLTRSTIEILHNAGLKVAILTKGGKRAMRDFDLLRPGDEFAVTLTLLENAESKNWEPNAALPSDRIYTLIEAHKLGIKTWVSLEPVINTRETQVLVNLTKEFVDLYKVGVLNYHPYARNIPWREFGWQMKAFMEEKKVKYIFKQDLIDRMTMAPGIGGRI